MKWRWKGLTAILAAGVFAFLWIAGPVSRSRFRFSLRPVSGKTSAYQRGGEADRLPWREVRAVVERTTGRVPVGRADDAIHGERLVLVGEGVDPDALAARVDGVIVGRLDAVRAYRIRFATERHAAAAAARLSGMAEVDGLALNLRIPAPESPVWIGTANAVSVRPVVVPAIMDGDIVIGLLDTAVDPGAYVDAFLLYPPAVEGGFPGVTGSDEEPRHATAVAAAILDGLSAVLGAGAVSGVRILPVDVFGDAGETTSFRVAEGILRAIEGGASVINMSFGGDHPDPFTEQMIRAAYGAGVVLVGAAGNEGVEEPRYPAAYVEVVAATALDEAGGLAAHANRGSFVDVAAPGSVAFTHGGGWYFSMGTSMSAGYVSGVIAAMAESLGIPAGEAEEAVRVLMAPP